MNEKITEEVAPNATEENSTQDNKLLSITLTRQEWYYLLEELRFGIGLNFHGYGGTTHSQHNCGIFHQKIASQFFGEPHPNLYIEMEKREEQQRKKKEEEAIKKEKKVGWLKKLFTNETKIS